MKPLIRIEGVTKRFGDFAAVDNVSLEVVEGEFFALLGPSGCGKTTLLRMLAGFDIPTGGRILIDGQDMHGVPPNKRPVNMVFQSYAVFPHMSVRDNVGYGLRMDGVTAKERAARVGEVLALVKRPRVLLLDEPLSALDAKLRETMRIELAQIQEKVGVTFVMVTHDQDEALAMATRCAVMHKGLLQQVASPSDLYDHPANSFVADFIGSVNMFEGRVAVNESGGSVIGSPDLGASIHVDEVTGAEGATVWVAIRPEKIEMHHRDEGSNACPHGANAVPGIVRHIAYLGSETMFEVEVASGRRIKVLRSNVARYDERGFDWGQPVWLNWHPRSPAVLLS
jgi:spermidine/putrescine transport system ATP-binding protein